MTASLAAIVLAAGLSTRMGHTKALLHWDGRPLVAFQIDTLRRSGVGEIVVVTGHDAIAVSAAAAAAGARAVFNPAYQEGRAGSLRIGAAALGTPRAVLILNVDQPRPASLVRALLKSHRQSGALITVPAYGGRRGHPPVLSGSLLAELRSVTEEEQGLRAVMLRHAGEVHEMAAADDGCLLDLNTPAAYEQALDRFGLARRTAAEGGL